ncbi:unnamed protein product [Bemisia tabaci]|uniref:F-box domain-containing protein n=1 Tax=Bemisia tabaci TaxID=7038 RepID=A0A9P0A8Z5_BEMTA|nr:unnamed protein product [Bemisia tabaci]
MPSGLLYSLCRAVNRGDLGTVKNLFSVFGFNWQELAGGYLLVCTAAEQGFTDIVKFLIENGAEVKDFIKAFENTPLHFAVLNNKLELIKILLDKGVSIDEKNQHCQTPLLIAIEKGFVEIAKFLVKNGAQVNAANNGNSDTPLHFAVQHNSSELVEMLVKCAVVDAMNEKHQTPLLLAAEKGYVEIAKLLLMNGAQVNGTNVSDRDTPLHLAVQNNCIELVEILLEQGALIDARNGERQTSLHIATEKGNENCMLLLLRKGAYVDPIARFGETPLRIAVKKQSLSSVECILKFCPNLNKNIYKTILKTAMCGESREIVSRLIQYGFSLSQADVHDCGLLHATVEKGQLQLVKFLLNHCADPNCLYKGNTPLHSAVRNGNIEIVQLLLKANCRVNAVDTFGKTPLYYSIDYSKKDKGLEMLKLLLTSGAKINSKKLLHDAVKYECFEICEVLTNNGANPNYPRDGHLPLHSAIKSGRTDIVKLLLDAKSNVDAVDESGKTPIDYSVEHAKNENGTEIFKLLLANGATVDKSLLHNVVKNECFEICEVLINNGCDVNALDEHYRTPLLYTAYPHSSYFTNKELNPDETYRIQIAELLLNSGADVNAKCKRDETALHFATQFGFERLVWFLLQNGADVNSFDKLGNTALTFAVDRGYTNILKALIIHGADVNAVNPYMDLTPLHEAAISWRGIAETVEILLEHGADIHKVTDNDETALHLASERAHAAVLDVLLKNGADVNALNGDGLTALHVVGREEHDVPYDAVRVLLKHGADVNCRSPSGETPLHMSVQRWAKRHKKVLRLLLESGADVNAACDKGMTPLHIAAGGKGLEDRVKLVKLLLKYKADVNKKNVAGETALHRASWKGHHHVEEVLLSKGADINLLNNLGQTALDLTHDENIFLSSSFDSIDGCPELSRESLQYHAIMLKTAGFFVCQNNLKWIEDSDNDFLVNIKYFCEKEVAMMKSHKLCCHLSLFDFLVGNTNPRCFNDQNLHEALDSVDFHMYNIYRDLLVRNIRDNKLRWKLLTAGFDWFIILIKTGNILNKNKIALLPPELVEKVLEYLNNESLNSLILCGKQVEKQFRKSTMSITY